MESNNSPNSIWQYATRIGLLAGIALLYVGLIGMLADFNEKELIRKLITLGQVLLVVPTIAASLAIGNYARKDRGEHQKTPWALIPANIYLFLQIFMPQS